MYGQGDSHPGMFTCFPWFGYSPWMHYDESLHIPVIDPHGRIKIDYCIEAENKYRTCSDVKCFEIYVIFY
jgi:hypothetical protein